MIVTVVGSQLGDEGKGGIVDVFGEAADVIVRYQGGDNAGHTVIHDGETYKLSLVPSGAIRGKVNILGNGCVVNPRTLFDEIDALNERGIDPDVRVDRRAHVIFPYHRVLDGIEEAAKTEDDREVGTTGRGIGPTYEDKAARRGVRIGDLVDPAILRERLEYVVPQKRTLATEVFGADVDEAFDLEALIEEFAGYGQRLANEDRLVDAGSYLSEAIEDGSNVMFEGAQGTLLDIDHGNYPYVTSSNPSAGGAATGAGIGPGTVGGGDVIGIVKGYLSRVGSGPMPTEVAGVVGDTPGYDEGGASTEEEAIADYIREAGGEYGTVTNRPRRVGWLDLSMLKHSTQINGFTGLVVNHIDTLSGLDEVKLGVAYERNGSEVSSMPATTEAWAECTAVLETMPGWDAVDWKTIAAEGYESLPGPARAYLERIEDAVGVDIIAVGVGPDRAETIIRRHPFK